MRQQQYHFLHAWKLVLTRRKHFIGDALHTSLLLQQVDNRHQKEPLITSEQAKRICDRNFGVGGDGVRDFSCNLCVDPLQHSSLAKCIAGAKQGCC